MGGGHEDTVLVCPKGGTEIAYAMCSKAPRRSRKSSGNVQRDPNGFGGARTQCGRRGEKLKGLYHAKTNLTDMEFVPSRLWLGSHILRDCVELVVVGLREELCNLCDSMCWRVMRGSCGKDRWRLERTIGYDQSWMGAKAN